LRRFSRKVGIVPPSQIVRFTEWVVVIGVRVMKYIEYIYLLGFDNWQPGSLFNQMVLTVTKIKMGDTTGLDGSE